jgi:hypothetical protein
MNTYDALPNAIMKYLSASSSLSRKPIICRIHLEDHTQSKSATAKQRYCKAEIARAQVCVDLLRVARSLAVAAYDFDLIRMDRLARVLHLEYDILDQESPDLIAEAVCIKMALHI